jgi:predicted metal-dependent phosphoesterase TrpH
MKNRNILLVIALLFIAAWVPVNGRVLYDLAAGRAADGFSVSWPAWRYLIEPVSFIAEYTLSFTRYIVQILSWLFWCCLLVALCGIAKKASATAILKRVLASALVILTIAALTVILPLPAPRLTVPAGQSAWDLHSHTNYSHDGVVSPAQSLRYHRNLGFARFFDTEHGHTDVFAHFPPDTQLSTVFPGMQISTREKISLLVLADRPFDGAEFRHKTVKEVIDLAHAKGFIAACPHWWKWRHFTWAELAALGIDGFEVYNAGYRNFPETEREQLIRFCRERNLLMFGTTDWHGWGYMSNVWTVADSTGTTDAFFADLRQHRALRVLVYRRPELQTTFRYLFEPFFGVYYNVVGMDWKSAAGWAGWLLLIGLLLQRVSRRKLMRGMALLAALLLFGLIVHYLIAWIPLLPENMILGRLLAPILAVLCFGWLMIWRVYGKTAE